MNKRALLLALLLLATKPAAITYGQTSDLEAPSSNTSGEQMSLVSDLRLLDRQSEELSSPLARARAKAEIADPLWHLDRKEAERILTNACLLTVPDKDDSKGLRD